jgi:uncharacterized membrane protein YgcG
MKKGFFLVLLCVPLFTLAQTDRSYFYRSIDTLIDVQTDTTLKIEERQEFVFNGEFHQAVRSIPHKAIDSVSDIAVIDAVTGQSLTYSSSRLDKTDSSSWGRFTTYREGGATHIEWYYGTLSATTTVRTWLLQYTIHGALAFYKDYDELYWNLFTEYDVPIDSVTALVRLPGDITAPKQSFYRNSNLPYDVTRPDSRSFFFQTANISAQEDVTIAVGWQKGLVDESVYWQSTIAYYWKLVAALGLVMGAGIFAVVYGYVVNRRHRGRGTIVPQYEPPEKLPPAMAEVVAESHVTKRAWPATVVDLAVRGFIIIKHEAPPVRKILGLPVGMAIVLGALALVGLVLTFYLNWDLGGLVTLVLFLGTVTVVRIALVFGINLWSTRTHYVLEKTSKDISNLEDYEKKFLDILFPLGMPFVMDEVLKSQSRRRSLAFAIQDLSKELYKETEKDLDAHAVDPHRRNIGLGILILTFFVGLFAAIFLDGLVTLPSFILFAAILIAGNIIAYAIWFKPRLNRRGNLLKEDWLGFKMYLETAERYRMQNLTPETFEKYLPYAVLFGIEKKWAKAFEPMHLPPPTWYAGTVPVGNVNAATSATSFSPSDFSSGFSANFVSAFTSAGGGGASGGGGGAGGGGGGGGGGAS